MTPVRAGHGVGLVAAAVVLAPFATLALPFQDSLMVRAALVSALTAALVGTALLSPNWWQRLRARPGLLLAGCACWAAAAALGAAVAVARGNEPNRLAGQLLSMGLLPAAAVAGLAVDRSWRSLRVGVVAAVTVGAWVQLGWWLWSLLGDHLSDRLYLPNSVSAVGPALLALTLAVSLLVCPDRGQRALAWMAVVTIAVLIAGSAVRALWLVSVPSVILQLILSRGWSQVLRPRRVLVAVVALATVGLGHLLVGAWLAAPRPSLLTESPGSTLVNPVRDHHGLPADGPLSLTLPRPRGRWSDPVPVEQPGTYLLEARCQGGSSGTSLLVVRWLDRDGQPIGRLGVRVPAGEDEVVVRNHGATPAATRAVFVRWGGDRQATGTWTLSELSLRRLGPARVAPLLRQREVWLRRARSLVALIAGHAPTSDPALAFRLTETRRVLSELGGFSTGQWLAGRGLGATFHLGVEGYDNRGNLVWHGDVNYIHNLYLFLLFKLGLIGAGCVLGALAAWIWWTVRRTLSAPPGERRALLAALAAAWIGYCAWALTSPELIDFSMAPLFGLLVAAGADAASE